MSDTNSPGERPERPERPSRGGSESSTPPPMGPMPSWPSGEGDAPAAPTQRPRLIQIAMYLMYAGAALSAVSVIAVFGSRDQLQQNAREALRAQKQPVTSERVDSLANSTMMFIIALGVIMVALWILMAIMNGKGKGWARIMASILAVANIWFNLRGLSIVGIALILVGIVSAVMLWLPAARPWFETSRRSRA
jgi:hypothetical protein